ncbi:MAG TPA: hypothetical protein PKA20_07645 [Burkholderiaceae bacterium]|nr:hypothetical protein [Burkholderiaceae bacterium]
MSPKADPRIREHLPEIIAGALLLLALALAVVAWQRFDRIQQRQHDTERERIAMRRTIADLRQNRDDAVAFGPRFVALRAAGSIGTFDKPRALDAFEAYTRAFGDQVQDYSLAAQTAADLPAASALQHHDLFRHQLDFELRPLHEETFITMLDTLRGSLDGSVAIESCDLSRRDGGSEPGLAARCTLNWYSFVPRGAAPGVTGSTR